MRTELRRAVRTPSVMVGAIGLLILVGLVAFPGLVTQHDPDAQVLSARLAPPFWMDGSLDGHPLGTDHLGRDIVARTLYGGRVSLMVGFISATVACVVGTLLGLLAGLQGGWVDRLITQVGRLWLAFPFMVLAVATVAVVGSDVAVLMALLAVAAWVTPTFVTRATAAALRGEDYVEAARGMGAGTWWIIRHHLLRAVLPAAIVVWTLTVGTLVVIEGGLSFIGLGVRPPTASWGTMLSDGRGYLENGWWLVTVPGVALTMVVLFTNLLGDGLRDVFDVKGNS